MQAKQLSNDALVENLELLVQKERELTAEIVEHIAEVERRRLYLKEGKKNLFQYLTEKFGYSNGPAQRRIDAARLLLDAPELRENLEKGEINLSQVAVLASGFRQVETSKEQKKELLEQAKGLSVEKTQELVAQTLDIQPIQFDKVKHQGDGSKRIEFTVSEEAWKKFQRLKEVLSHVYPGGGWQDVLLYAAEEVLKKKDPMREKKTPAPVARAPASTAQAAQSNASAQYQVVVKKPNRAEVRRTVFQRDQCCQWKDPRTVKICGSRFQLEEDHIISRSKNGKDTLENLQINAVRLVRLLGISGVKRENVRACSEMHA